MDYSITLKNDLIEMKESGISLNIFDCNEIIYHSKLGPAVNKTMWRNILP